MEPKKLAGVAAAILAVVLGTLALDSLSGVLAGGINLPDAAQNFVTVFLGIFIEAAPFLLIGALASGFIAVFVTPETLARLVPRNIVLATLFGALLGMIFPVCECGVVPVARRLYRKGLPTPVGIVFLLGAPVLNPIVIASTYAAFGPGPIFGGALGSPCSSRWRLGWCSPPSQTSSACCARARWWWLGGWTPRPPARHPPLGRRCRPP